MQQRVRSYDYVLVFTTLC